MNYENRVYDEGALKLTFDKKVRFGEQLSFAGGPSNLLFESELAKPIEFRNTFKLTKNGGSLKKKALTMNSGKKL